MKLPPWKDDEAMLRWLNQELDRINALIVVELQQRGIAAPSTTQIGGRLAIRACLCSHRTEQRDLDALVDGVLQLGRYQRGASR